MTNTSGEYPKRSPIAGVSRPTASKYLEQLTGAGLVRKQKIGRTNLYINDPLFALLSGVSLEQP